MPRSDHGPQKSGYVAAVSMATGPLHSLLVQSAEGELSPGNAVADNPVGTLQNLPAAGEGVLFQPIKDGDTIPMIASAAIAAGAEVTPTTTGRIVTNAGPIGAHILGHATEAAGANGDLIGIFVQQRTQE